MKGEFVNGSGKNIESSESANILAIHRQCAFAAPPRENHGSRWADGPANRCGSRAGRTSDYWSYTPDDWEEFDEMINRLCDALGLPAGARAAALETRRRMPIEQRPAALASLRQKLRNL